MRNFLKKYSLWITSLFYLVLILAGGYLFFIPLIRDIAINSNKIQERIADNEIYNRRISQLEEMENEHLKMIGNEEKMNIFLGEEREVEFIRQLEALAGETGNSISFKVSESALAGKETEDGLEDALFYKNFLTLEVELKSDYGKIMLFLHRLENMPNYVNVISIMMEKEEPEILSYIPTSGMFSAFSPQDTRVPSKDSSGKIKANIKMLVYKK